jgi:hypothetical protein
MKTMLLTLGFLGFCSLPTLAEPYNGTTTGDFQKNEVNPASGGLGDGSFNPMNLIHNANFNRGRDASQFQDDSRDVLDKKAAEFKRLQQQQLQQNSPPVRQGEPK